ncbi:sulfite exporter TauE/SafE family protein [Brumimicrobium mesophilum]|uniref:sulfite exporter TauE/SafE family protein n=1 Tax=Brumimicrobium mesophilum TaxID=392717 RepID=UPI000D140B81|nr:sulfite exporter TauE/SafE family protein [Brumimicrobium mesophilum]
MDSIINIVILAFTLGLVTNLHCIGMCGPISMALPLNRKSKATISGGITSYSLGRSLGYTIMGLIVGIIGLSASLLGVLQWLSILSGIIIIFFAWGAYYKGNGKVTWFNKVVMRTMSKFLQAKPSGTPKLIGIGFINAFLPCGMVYVALGFALTMGSVQKAMIYMFVFGLGTLPGFIFLGVLKDFFARIGFFNRKFVFATLISIVGLFMVIRGLNLGIPYVSPKIEMMIAKGEKEKIGDPRMEVKMTCCSSKNKK